MLDVKVWVERHEIENLRGERTSRQILLHEFYEKPIVSKLVMMNPSAMPQKQKVTTLVQETIRRLRNTSRRIGKEQRVKILQKFVLKLKRSGYPEKTRRDIVEAGIKGY